MRPRNMTDRERGTPIGKRKRWWDTLYSLWLALADGNTGAGDAAGGEGKDDELAHAPFSHGLINGTGEEVIGMK